MSRACEFRSKDLDLMGSGKCSNCTVAERATEACCEPTSVVTRLTEFEFYPLLCLSSRHV